MAFCLLQPRLLSNVDIRYLYLMTSLFSSTPEGIYCPAGNFYLDPWMPVDYAVITHGHADHARPGMGKYLCHKHSIPILKLRIGNDINIQGLDYGEPLNINGVTLSLHPAGHITGSAQVRIEYKGNVLVYTGDYKIQDDGLSAPFELVKCHELITESTFALPVYNWLPVEEMEQKIQQWVLSNKEQAMTSVLVGYSLGKAQRIMKAVQGIGKIYVHSSIGKTNEAMTSVGIKLPAYEVLDFTGNMKPVRGEIVVVPPALMDSNMIRRVPDRLVAYCSGWMQVRGARRWRAADAGFAISDHADWKGLTDVVKNSGAEKVYITHGQVDVFSKYLNETGINAVPLQTRFGNEDEGEAPNIL